MIVGNYKFYFFVSQTYKYIESQITKIERKYLKFHFNLLKRLKINSASQARCAVVLYIWIE